MTAPGIGFDHFRSLPDSALTWLLVFDRSGLVRRAGKAWSEHSVAGSTEALPPAWELLNLDNKRWTMCWNAVRSGSTVTVNAHPVVRPDGRLVYLDWELLPGAQVGCGPAAAVFFATDVSARVRAELACGRLEKERDGLQKDMDQFVEAASHDLKEPLRNVSNFVQLLRHRYGEQLGGEGADYIAYAVGGVRRMWALMDELLLFANLGKSRERYGWTVPEHLLADAMVQLDRPGELRTKSLPDQVYGHPAQLALLFRHLLDNGFRYNPNHDRVVGVECLEEQDHWIISVWDNGPGIAPEFQQRAFSLFKRLHGQEETPGRGMGLSICRKVVELHGGHIRLASEMGRGTALHVWLPKNRLSEGGTG
jgi:signal transduction histidine kinase